MVHSAGIEPATLILEDRSDQTPLQKFNNFAVQDTAE